MTLLSALFTYMIYLSYGNAISIALGIVAIVPSLYGIAFDELPISTANFQIGLLFFVGALMSQSGNVQNPLFSIGLVICAIASILIMSVENGDLKNLMFCFVFIAFVNTMSVYLCSELNRHCPAGDVWGCARSQNDKV
jgi:hypothetical protein